jgi:asparagine synthase (glutamine-hydrolysing)
VAVYSRDSATPAGAQGLEALRTMAHRGPDDEGLFAEGGIFLGHRRLSILDLSPAGHQPMLSRDKRVALVFNGQIYNYRELRQELQGQGHEFSSTSDTEVLLASYLVWGEDCFERLRGMWAVIIWDARTQSLLFSRDRIGLKPLYCYEDGSRLILSSEIKAILALDRTAAKLDRLTATRYLSRGWLDFTDRTFFESIRAVPPGTVHVVSNGHVRSRRFWSLQVHVDEKRTPEELAEVFGDTMRRHLQSDVPIAIALSGGVDSSSMACLTAREAGMRDKVHGFSICPPDTPDESFWIDATVRHAGIGHTYVDPGSIDYESVLDEMIGFHDEPPPKVNHVYQYLLRKAAGKAGYKVLLSGEGGDEILGGYARYAPMYLASMLELGRLDAVAAFLEGAGELTGQTPPQMLAAAAAFLRTRLGARTMQEHRFGYDLVRDPVDDAVAFPLFDHPEVVGEKGMDLMREMLDRFRLDMPHVLKIEDRNGMAHGVEVRVPFLDHVMVEFCYGFPGDMYMRGGVNKYPLRAAMAGVLPPEINECRVKMRRPGSDAYVVYDKLAPVLRDMLRDPSLRSVGLWVDDLADRFDADCAARAPHQAFVWFRTHAFLRWMHRYFPC